MTPVFAGADKLFHVLVNGDSYLAPAIANVSTVGAQLLLGIVINLLMIPGYHDIALRDLSPSQGALALGRLSQEVGSQSTKPNNMGV
jgi:hypothetical protein